MKAVSGKVISKKLIYLSKAAKVISNSVVAETGASQAVSAYLRRSSVSFNELVHFHRELKASKSSPNHKRHAQERSYNEGPVKYEQNPEGDEMCRNNEDSGGSDSTRKWHKKKKREDVEREGGGSSVIDEGIGKERKDRRKRNSVEVDDGEVVDLVEQSSSKKKKKRRRIGHDR